LTNFDGRYEGNFEKGEKSGLGTMTDASGKKYEGSFLRNKPNGKGKVYDEKGVVLKEGWWVDGKIEENP
jgi:hypothetical protein